MRRAIPTALAVTFCLIVAAPAGAVTVRVNAATGVDSGSCGTGPSAKPCRTVKSGANRAGNLPSDDVIEIAAGLYPETATVTVGSHDVLDGAGSCSDAGRCTVIQPSAGLSTVVDLVQPGAGARQLRVVGVTSGVNNRRVGIRMVDSTTLTDVSVVMQGAANDLSAVLIAAPNHGAVVLDSLDVHGNGTGAGVAITSAAEAPATLTIRDSSIDMAKSPGVALGTTPRTVVERSFLHSGNIDPGSSASQVIGGLAQMKSLRIDSSLITGGGFTINSAGTLTLNNSTVDSGLPGGSDNFPVTTEFADQLEFSIVTNSILLGTPSSVAGGVLSCRNTDVVNTVSGKVTCPSGAGNALANTFTPPGTLFQNFAAGDYRLRPGSPAIDSGSTAALKSTESKTDRAGNPRLLDGNGDCRVIRDRGAYELTGHECPAIVKAKALAALAPKVSGVAVKPRIVRDRRKPVKLSFRLDKVARVGVELQRRVRIRGKIRYRKSASFKLTKAKVGKTTLKVPKRIVRRLRRGSRYRVVVKARDTAGKLSKPARGSFRVARGAR